MLWIPIDLGLVLSRPSSRAYSSKDLSCEVLDASYQLRLMVPDIYMSSKLGVERRKILFLLPSSLFFFVILPIVTLFVGERVDSIFGIPPFPIYPFNYAAGLVILILGAAIVLESIRLLLKEGKGVPLGDLLPYKQSKTLITSGIYAHTRNPMLLGYLMSLCGLGLISQSPSSAFILPLVYTAIWTVWIKKREEPALLRRFGEAYHQYKARTPFLIPRSRRKSEADSASIA